MWKYVGCAVQGRGHKDKNIPCQDKVFGITDGHTSVMALADGAGSAKLSHYGAELIVKAICGYAKDNFDLWYGTVNAAVVKQEIIKFVSEKIKAEAVKRGCDSSELACTLLFVAVKNKKFIIGHVGDGVIGYVKNDEIKVASAPSNGEFVNQTFFVTSDNAAKDMKVIKGRVGDIQSFIIMSDGSEACLYSKAKNYLAPAIQGFVTLAMAYRHQNAETTLQEIFESVISQKTMDDCSIGLLVQGNFKNISYDKQCNFFDMITLSGKEKMLMHDFCKVILCSQSSQSTKALVRKTHFCLKKVRRLTKCLIAKEFLEKLNNGNYQATLDMGIEEVVYD